MKRLLWWFLGLTVSIAIIAVILAAYLNSISRRPTGYDAIARLHQADVKTMINETGDAGPSATAPGKTSSPTSPTQSLATKNPRQKFQRCWTAITAYHQRQWTPAHAEAYSNLTDLYQDVSIRRNKRGVWDFTISTTLAEGEELGKHLNDPAAFGQTLRLMVEKNGLTPLRRRSATATDAKPLTPSKRAAKIAGVAGVPPLQEAVDLLSLPDSAVPAFPVRQMQPSDGRFLLVLGQAYLYALVHNPDFDPVAGLRRIKSVLQYMQLIAYPASLGHYRIFDFLLDIVVSTDVVPVQWLKPLTAEFSRLQIESSLNHAPAEDKIRRFRAEIARTNLTTKLDDYLAGRTYDNNTFHYILGGIPERLWLKTNAANIRRHIDLYAVALAKGNAVDEQMAFDAMQEALRLANLGRTEGMTRMCDSFSWANQGSPSLFKFPADILLLALKTYWLDHHQLPEELADLSPDYLPASALKLWSVAWVVNINNRPTLVKASADMSWFLTHEILIMARHFAPFRAYFLQQYEIALGQGRPLGPPPPDVEIEKDRLFLLKHSRDSIAESNVREIKVICIPIDFAADARIVQSAAKIKQNISKKAKK